MQNSKALIISSILIIGLVSCQSKKDTPETYSISQEKTKEQSPLSIAQKLRANDHLPIQERIALYKKLKSESPELYNFENEDEMTMYGYSFLWDGNVAEAKEIFKLIVEQFPDSSNPYDSLGEAYMEDGDFDLAILNYEKSLELNPDNFHAEDQIERMKFPHRKELSPADKFVKVYSIQEYHDDLDQLGEKLTEVHPAVFKFTSEKDFWKCIEEKKNSIDENTSFAEFRWMCAEIIAQVNCSHTSSGRFYPENRMLHLKNRFPLQTRYIHDHLYVVNANNSADIVFPKDEILSINGIRVEELVEEIYRHIPSQGLIKSSKRQEFNFWSSGMISYALGLPESYEITIKRSEQPIKLKVAEMIHEPRLDESIDYCGQELCLEFVDESTALMSISSFNFYPWNNLKEFTSFMDESFTSIQNKKIKNLIIDLRFNGGGSPESSIYLLQYLINKPFEYFGETNYPAGAGTQYPHEPTFDGKQFFIIDGNGNSTTGHFMAKVKELNLGTIIGEELGSNQFCTAGQGRFRLKNTKLDYDIAQGQSELINNPFPDEIGILPDYEVYQSIDEYLEGIDTVKEFTLDLVKKQ